MITQEFNLNLHAGHSIPLVIYVSQYEKNEQWLFTIINQDGTQYRPESASIVGTKSDGNLITNEATVDSDGRVVVEVTEQIAAAAGKAVFELRLDDQQHGTANFVVLVEKSPADGGVPSESDLSLIQRAIDGTSATAIAQGVGDWMDENLTPTTPVVDQSLTVQGAAADSKKVGDELNDLKSQIEQSGGGLSSVAVTLLMGILRNALYATNQTTNINNLETELTEGGGGSDRVAVVNNLTNCTSNNDAISVEIGSAYIATITADENYELDTATVLMGDEDVTSTVYRAGVISIPNVTGTISITVTAVSVQETGLIHYFNFKTGSLIDTIDETTACTIPVEGTSITEGTGVTVASATQYLSIPFSTTAKRAKIKFGAMEKIPTGSNVRLLCRNASATGTPTALLKVSGETWYADGVSSALLTGANVFANDEIVIQRGSSSNNVLSVYYGGNALYSDVNPGVGTNYLMIGSNKGNSFYNVTIESVKLYNS